MQRDEPSLPSQPFPATSPGATPPAAHDPQRSSARRAALGALVLATSLAVASYASPWLVPPYLALMAWLLWPSFDRRACAADAAGPEALEPLGDVGPAEGCAESPTPSWDDATPSEPAEDPAAAASADSATATTALKTKRGRSRGRKARPATAVEPATHVTWIRVGPGKFVRVEGADATVPDAAPVAEAENDRAEAVPALPPSPTDAPSDEAETAPAAGAEAEARVEAPDAGTTEAEPSSADAADVQRQATPECTDETNAPPQAVDVPPAACVDDPEPAVRVEAIEDAEFGPAPTPVVDSVDAPAAEDGSEPADPIPDVTVADHGPDACAVPQDVSPPTAVAPSIPDGPPTRSAGRALWVGWRAVCPRPARPVRPVAERPPTRRATRAGRSIRVTRVLRRHPRRGYARRASRMLHARSPPG